MKKGTLLAIVLFSTLLANGQQEFMVTHYMFNGLALNPAYAGIHEGISTSFLYRNQWAGFEGAPNTQLASIHSPLNHRPVSLGAVLYRDQIGISSEYGVYLSYAYRIRLSETFQFSMGLQASTHSYDVNYSQASEGFGYDDEGLGNISEFKWNFGSGFMVHSDRAYLGLSIPQILNKKLDVDDPDGAFSELIRHYYVSAGYVFNLNRDLILKPNVLMKAVEKAPIQVDLNANLLIKSLLWLGVSYRSFDSIDALVGFQITPQMMFSYATDFTLTEIDTQSHELMLNYIFELPTKRILTPRYF